jgi:hypothetical protein
MFGSTRPLPAFLRVPASRHVAGAALLLLVSALLTTPAYASQDVVQFGTTIKVPKDAAIHDAVCFFCSVEAEGAVNGDIVVFFGDVHIGTKASHDVVNFFGHVRAEDETSIGGDLVSMFGGVHLGENVSVGKDMVSMFGSFSAPETVSVGGDRVIQSAWVFWTPLLLIVSAIWLLVHEVRGRRARRILRGY